MIEKQAEEFITSKMLARAAKQFVAQDDWLSKVQNPNAAADIPAERPTRRVSSKLARDAYIDRKGYEGVGIGKPESDETIRSKTRVTTPPDSHNGHEPEKDERSRRKSLRDDHPFPDLDIAMNILVRALAVTQDPDTKMLLLRQIEQCVESKTIGLPSTGSMARTSVGRESLSTVAARRSISPGTREQREYRNRSPENRIPSDLEAARHLTSRKQTETDIEDQAKSFEQPTSPPNLVESQIHTESIDMSAQ
jgi:hypothetical protein